MADDPATTASSRLPDADADNLGLSEPAAELGEDTSVEILPAGGPLRTVLQWLGLIEQVIGVLLLLVILGTVLIQVGQRYAPLGFASTGEIARFAMVWATFVLSGYLMAHDRHIAIHVVDYVVPVRVLGAVQLLAHIVVTVTCGAMAYAIYDLIARDRGQVTAEAQIPLALVYSVPLLGFVLTTIRAVVAVVILDLPELLGTRDKTS